MNSTLNGPARVQQISYRRLWWVTPLAGLLAAAANTALFYVGEALGLIPKVFVFSTSNQPLSAGLVASFSFMGVLVGGGTLAALGRLSRRPIFLFRFVSVGFLLLFAVAPLTIGAAIPLILLLELMHLVAGVIAIYTLTTLSRRSLPDQRSTLSSL